MLLVAYERNEGQSYLSALLTQPLTLIFPLLANCEMDLQKLKSQYPESSQEELDSILESNRKTLETACAKLFDGIFDANRKVPVAITEMCSFLNETIDSVMKPLMLSSKGTKISQRASPVSSSPISDSSEPKGLTEKESPKGKGLMRILSKKKIEFKLQDKKVEQEPQAKNVLIRNAMAKREAEMSPRELGQGRDIVTDSFAENMQLGQSYLDSNFEAYSAYPSPRISSTTPLASLTGFETPRQTQVSPQASPHGSDTSLKTTTSTADESIKASDERIIAPKKEDMIRRPTTGASLGNLSLSEKVVGSFLFLRFIVPGNDK
jgi:hypothetical protein